MSGRHRLTPRRILFAHSGRDWIRGSERCLLDLMARLDRARFAPVLLCDSPVLAREARAVGASAESLPAWEAGWRPPALQVRRVWDLARHHGVGLFHANNLIPLPTLIAVARLQRLPVLAQLHLLTTREERLHSWLHQVRAVVGVSHHAVAGVRDDGMRPERVHVIYNGVDRKRLDVGDARGLRAGLGIAPEALVVAVTGSLIAIKRQCVVLDALSRVRARGARVHLLLIGEGESREALRAQAADLRLSDGVTFLGERGDVGAILRDAADVAVTASRMEAFPLNVLEAQWAGVPVVASDIPAHREGVVDGTTGLLFPVDDAAVLAERLLALAADPARRRQMGGSGRAAVDARFTLERNVREFETLYDALLGEAPRRHGLSGLSWPPVYGAWVREALRRRVRRTTRRR